MQDAKIERDAPRQWIERNGGPEPITPRFASFLEKVMSGRSLDLEGDVETRPDYSCLGGAIAIEIKTLEGDPSERLSNAITPAKERETWPKYLGPWPMEAIYKNLPPDEAEALKKALIDRLGRSIVTHMKKANTQLGAFARANDDLHLKLLVLINEDFAEYDPKSVAYIVQREFHKRKPDGANRYSDIHAVLYLTERHATQLHGKVTFPILQIFGPDIEESRVALELMRRTVIRWGKANTDVVIDGDEEGTEFVTIDEIPERMRTQDVWEREYKKAPYMSNWTDQDVIEFWDFTMLMTIMAFHVAPPMEVPPEGRTKLMEAGSHLMREFAKRGIALDRLKPTKARNEVAISKMTYGPTVQEWLRQELGHID